MYIVCYHSSCASMVGFCNKERQPIRLREPGCARVCLTYIYFNNLKFVIHWVCNQ